MGLKAKTSQHDAWFEVGVDDLKAGGENALATGPFGSSVGSQFFQTDGVPLIRGSNLANDGKTHLVDDGFVFLSDEKAAEFGRSTVVKDDLIFTCWGTINQVGLISSRAAYPRYIISNKQMKFTPSPLKADSLFLFYLFSSAQLQRQIRVQSIGTSVPGFNLRRLRALRFNVPDLPEQRAIAEALSDVDGLLGGLDRLIAKKRDLKQATMQQLLTGQTRLPGFSGEWEVKRLGDSAALFSGGTPPTGVAAYYDGDIPWIRSGDLNKGYITDVEGRISHAGLTNSASKMVEANTLLIALYGATSGVTAVSRIRAAINQAVLAIVPRQDDTVFLYFKLRLLKDWLISTYTQGGQPNLSGDIVKSVELTMPPIPEQRAIATVLSDMGAEIEALEARRAKTRDLKRAMIQELLTGKTRLVPTGVVHA